MSPVSLTSKIFRALRKEAVNSPEGTISVCRTEKGRPQRDAPESLIWLSQPYRCLVCTSLTHWYKIKSTNRPPNAKTFFTYSIPTGGILVQSDVTTYEQYCLATSRPSLLAPSGVRNKDEFNKTRIHLWMACNVNRHILAQRLGGQHWACR